MKIEVVSPLFAEVEVELISETPEERETVMNLWAGTIRVFALTHADRGMLRLTIAAAKESNDPPLR